MPVTDYAGTWEYKGTVTPLISVGGVYNWSRFPYACANPNGTIRLTYYGDFSKVISYGFLRLVFDTGEQNYSRWTRLYPSADRQLLSLPIPEELLINSAAVPRYFEVTKVYKRAYRRRYGTLTDNPWSLAIEALEQPALPAELYAHLSNPQRVIAQNSGNIVIVIDGDT